MKKTFSRDYLINELNLPDNAIKETIVDTSRWSVLYEIIFEDNGKFYQAMYSAGATESQDKSPWEYGGDVECNEVELQEVRRVEWVVKQD